MLPVKTIGLGTFPFASVFSAVDGKAAEQIVRRFLELGGTYIETAPSYTGVNQTLRIILADIPRESYYLASKCVTSIGPDGQKQRTGKYKAIIDQCERELKQLDLTYFDLYQSHIPAPDAHPRETMEALVTLQEQGKIRDIGVSNVSLQQLKEYNEAGPVKYVQNRFSLLHQSFDEEMNRYCMEHGILYNPYQIIERGQLTEKAIAGFEVEDRDLRSQKPEFAEDVRTVVQGWVANELKPIADSAHTSIEALAIWWTLQQPNMGVCVVGATNQAQVESNMQAAKLSPPADTLSRINEAYDRFASRISEQYGLSIPQFRGTA